MSIPEKRVEEIVEKAFYTLERSQRSRIRYAISLAVGADEVVVKREDLHIVLHPGPGKIRSEWFDACVRLAAMLKEPTPDQDAPCPNKARRPHGDHEWYIKPDKSWWCKACGAVKQAEHEDRVNGGEK